MLSLTGTIRTSVLTGLLLLTAGATAEPATLPTAVEAVAEMVPPLRLAVASAEPSRNRQSGAPVVLVTLSSDSSQSLRALTDANRGRILELWLGDTLLLAPKIVESFSGQTFQISGNLTVAATHEVARKLTSGGTLTARIKE